MSILDRLEEPSAIYFKTEYVVQASDIDGLGHMNNTVYLKLMENLAWAHSKHLGLGVEEFQRIGSAMVAREHRMTYLGALFLDETVQFETWLDHNNALNLNRYYRFTRVFDQKVVFEAHTHWVCISIATGRPQRMPPEFKAAYGVA
jgi:acyl-CoA thioester hydrolase